MSFPASYVHEFLRRLQSNHLATPDRTNRDSSNFGFDDASERELMVTSSRPGSLQLGTGTSIFTNYLIPAIATARREVILVTCFWAPSKTLAALCDALTKLAAHRRILIQEGLSREQAAGAIPPLKFRICLSSRSFLQKLLHPQSRNGYVYPPSAWSKKLGLPEPAVLEAGGIQLEVKSLFFLPFSVMHPKFVIVDRRRAFVPSCNVSWESWLEGCVEITGDAVRSLFSFYSHTWDAAGGSGPLLDSEADSMPGFDTTDAGLALVASNAAYHTTFQSQVDVATLVLPSSYHRNPGFRPFPWQRHPSPPGTPLNIALLQLLENAQRSIYIQTPNLTCEAVIVTLLNSLKRGVDVSIVTNRSMMLLEQLITAGTTTSWCIRSLIRRFHRIKRASGGRGRRHGWGIEIHPDPEASQATGRLRISYFRARFQTVSEGRGRRAPIATASRGEEPVHSHLKLTLVDGEYAVLGSGNMDRASFFTSQELGIAFYGHEFCATVKAGVEGVLEGRLELIFDSDDETRS